MAESKKMVIQVGVHDDEDKRKAFKAVCSHPGIESITMDMKDKKLTIIGVIDPVCAVRKLKKWYPEILTVGPAKEEKKEEKKDDKKDAEKKKKEEEEAFKKMMDAYSLHYPYMTPSYCVCSMEGNPNSCVIC